VVKKVLRGSDDKTFPNVAQATAGFYLLHDYLEENDEEFEGDPSPRVRRVLEELESEIDEL